MDQKQHFFENTMASAGMKQMTETGATSVIKKEFENKIKSGEGLKIISGSGVGRISVYIAVTKENSLVTLATMIAPSPDWYGRSKFR